ncbi:MAG: phosphonate ABC transporter ATP-binding protein [Pseudomonadota bacterium]
MLKEADTADPFVELRDVEVIYPNGTVALKPLSTHFADQDITVLLGPSGAGKSSLLRVLNWLVPPTRGEVEVRDIGALNGRGVLRRHRRETGVIFQQHQLIGRLSALQNVLIGRIGHYNAFRTLFPLPEGEQRWALECLERVGLLEKALVRCDALSGGQQQRVGIARALAQKPRLILADEPVASLDPASSERVLTLLQSICKQDRIPTVISLHQLEYARTYADRILGLALGEVVYDGPPEGLTTEALTRIYGVPAGAVSQAETPVAARTG